MGDSKVRIQPDRLVVIGKGVVRVTPIVEGDAPAVGIVGIETDRIVKVGDGAVVLALAFVNSATIEVGYLQLRIEADCPAVVGDSTLVFTLVLVSSAAVEVGGGHLRIKIDRVIEIGDSLVVLAHVRIGKPRLLKATARLDWLSSQRCRMRVQAAMTLPELEPPQSGQSSDVKGNSQIGLAVLPTLQDARAGGDDASGIRTAAIRPIIRVVGKRRQRPNRQPYQQENDMTHGCLHQCRLFL